MVGKSRRQVRIWEFHPQYLERISWKPSKAKRKEKGQSWVSRRRQYWFSTSRTGGTELILSTWRNWSWRQPNLHIIERRHSEMVFPRRGWFKWFWKRHPELVLWLAQGLDTNRAKNLNVGTVSTFYNNLKELLDKHQYKPAQIWNADETGYQAGQHGGGRVLAKIGTKYVSQTRGSMWLSSHASTQMVTTFLIYISLQANNKKMNTSKNVSRGQCMQCKRKHGWVATSSTNG
jgi:hypothetical protein